MNISSIYHLFKYANHSVTNYTDLSIAAKQISQSVILGRDFQFDDELEYINEKNEKATIYLDDNRIVKTPGFEIFAFDVDDLYFYEKNTFIYMNITRDTYECSYLIGSVIDE